jgi:hypothetical protein
MKFQGLEEGSFMKKLKSKMDNGKKMAKLDDEVKKRIVQQLQVERSEVC